MYLMMVAIARKSLIIHDQAYLASVYLLMYHMN